MECGSDIVYNVFEFELGIRFFYIMKVIYVIYIVININFFFLWDIIN